MPDNFEPAIDSTTAPSRFSFPITPSDVDEIDRLTKGVYVGTGGNLVVRSVDASQDVTFVNVPSGAILDIRVRAVRATGTSAANLVGLA